MKTRGYLDDHVKLNYDYSTWIFGKYNYRGWQQIVKDLAILTSAGSCDPLLSIVESVLWQGGILLSPSVQALHSESLHDRAENMVSHRSMQNFASYNDLLALCYSDMIGTAGASCRCPVWHERVQTGTGKQLDIYVLYKLLIVVSLRLTARQLAKTPACGNRGITDKRNNSSKSRLWVRYLAPSLSSLAPAHDTCLALGVLNTRTKACEVVS